MSSMKFPTQTRGQTRLDPERIAQEAFQIWQSEGCPEGRAEAHWQQAEARLAAQAATSRQPADRPTASAAPRRSGT